jgi:hypothetical protein
MASYRDGYFAEALPQSAGRVRQVARAVSARPGGLRPMVSGLG